MQATTRPNASEPLSVPEPVRHLEHQLRRGLVEKPGRASLERVFGPAETIQLELAVDALVAPLRYLRNCDDASLRRLRRYAAQATFSLRRVTDALGTATAPLAPAEATIADAVARADALGPAGINIAAVMRHIDLHVRIARLWEGETEPADLFNAINQAPARIREDLADWRAWSDERFGSLECIDPLANGACRQLGYRFEGRVHAVHYAGERRAHQGLIWQGLRNNELVMAKDALGAWRELHDLLYAAS
jgi:hypothetical protein